MATVNDILKLIVDRKKAGLNEEKKRLPLCFLKQMIDQLPATNRSFFNALKRAERIAIIAEIKKASPSKGVIRANLDANALAASLANAGAAALSVLTESNFFLGSRENLMAARAAAPNTPILCKDFIFDEYQIYQAKLWGADAVLLIAAMLSEGEMQQLSQVAKELGLDVLFEAHNEQEIGAIMSCSPKIVGINARNLKTFETSLETSISLMQLLPQEVVKVAESAITSASDLQAVFAAGANAALIGETLMRAENPDEQLEKLYEN